VLAWGAPGWLIAGALAGLVPLALHLIARHPSEPVALPTFRFLTRDPRSRLRLRRPTDLPLLLLRILLLLLFGAGLAGPRWLPERVGTAELVLLDRGAGMRGAAWAAAVDSARALLLGPQGDPRGGLVLFDTAAVSVPPARLTPALFDSLAVAGPGSAGARYAAGLRALRAAAAQGSADSVRAVLLTRPRAAAWSGGLRYVRRAAWPGRLRLPALPADAPPSARVGGTDSVAARTAAVVADDGGDYVAAALAASGWRVARGVAGVAGADAVVVLARPSSAGTASALLAAARAGATVVVAGPAHGGILADSLPWRPAGEPEPAPGAILLADGTSAAGAARRYGGAPTTGARLAAAWEDGRPAAAVDSFGRGCLVRVATDLETGELPLTEQFPLLIDGLLHACAGDGNGVGPDGVGRNGGRRLDEGGVALLRGSGPSVVPTTSLGGVARGLPLARWFLLGAVAVALLETWIAYFRP
jgi:hypothetical protein